MDRKVDVIMQLTKGFEQAACIMALLATQNRGIPLSSHVIHTRVSSSQTYLKKIMRKLVVGGLITSASTAAASVWRENRKTLRFCRSCQRLKGRFIPIRTTDCWILYSATSSRLRPKATAQSTRRLMRPISCGDKHLTK